MTCWFAYKMPRWLKPLSSRSNTGNVSVSEVFWSALTCQRIGKRDCNCRGSVSRKQLKRAIESEPGAVATGPSTQLKQTALLLSDPQTRLVSDWVSQESDCESGPPSRSGF